MPERKESSDDVFDEMEALVESSLPLVFSTYDEAIRQRIRGPVILLVDCEDALGREIAEAWVGREAVEDAVLTVQAEQPDDADEVTTVLARPMSLAACRHEVPSVFPYLAEAFKQPPSGAILVMIVAGGGAATFTVPLSERP